MPQPLNYKFLKKFIKENSHLFKELVYYPIIDSTNSEAFRIADKHNDNFIIITDSQSRGRGRFQRKWVSPENENLYFSLVMKNDRLFSDGLMIMAVSNAVIKTLNKYKIQSLIKWPNDIIIKDRKVCGILFEQKVKGNQKEYAVIGIGLNVFTDFSRVKALHEIATSMILYHNDLRREEIFIDLVKKIEDEFNDLIVSQGTVTFYLDHLYKFGKKIKFKTKRQIIQGVLHSIDENGHILIKTETGVKEFPSGEIIE
ncbi:MAG: biotin--[acetyl-CoA-carboxylase] ligase [Spirochaetes bacterium]|nr:biotin--[acetyl-CoA-carboxylase] ligase [Spirochaetota bacterium]